MAISSPEKAISEDLNREQLRTLAAAACGLFLGIVCMAKMWYYFVLTTHGGLIGQIIGALVLLLTCWLLSSQTPLCQLKLLERSSILLSELAGYFGFIIGLPCLIFLSAVAAGPAIQLAALYSEEGRFSLATMMAKLGVCVSQISPFVPAYWKLSRKTTLMRILFDAGAYEHAVEVARELASETEKNYNEGVTPLTQAAFLMVQPMVARTLFLAGQEEESKKVWNKVRELSGQGQDGLNNLAYAYRASFTAYAAVRLGDFDTALRQSELADRSSKNEMVPNGLAGCIEEHWALACLELGKLEDAEKHAKKSQSCWSSFLNKTAARMSEGYYVEGRVKLAQGKTTEARELLALAVAIRRRRYGRYHPELALALEAYKDCLKQAGQVTDSASIDREIAEIKAKHTSH